MLQGAASTAGVAGRGSHVQVGTNAAGSKGLSQLGLTTRESGRRGFYLPNLTS